MTILLILVEQNVLIQPRTIFSWYILSILFRSLWLLGLKSDIVIFLFHFCLNFVGPHTPAVRESTRFFLLNIKRVQIGLRYFVLQYEISFLITMIIQIIQSVLLRFLIWKLILAVQIEIFSRFPRISTSIQLFYRSPSWFFWILLSEFKVGSSRRFCIS